MPRKLKSGEYVVSPGGPYQIRHEMNVGALAVSYAATAPDGTKVFFKLYKSPTPTVPWFRDYVTYQAELKRRIEGTAARGFCYRFLDAFEAPVGAATQPTFFQSFEFVEGGEDLETVLRAIRENPAAVAWDQRLTMAKVMMAGVGALHEAGIAHGDLKPPNLQLFRDPSISAGYRLKLIDMDYSVLTGRQAPWHGHQGYVGSPGYFSPEHLAGTPPGAASDVFTCGLILYELLAQGHPYQTDDDASYRTMCLSGRPSAPRLCGGLTGGAVEEDVAAVLQHCLAPDPADRPSARDVNLILNGKMSAVAYVPPPAAESVVPAADVAPADSGVPAGDSASATTVDRVMPLGLPELAETPASETDGGLELRSESGASVRFRVKTPVGKHLARRFGEDSRFFDELQFTLAPDGEGAWSVEPNAAAANETLLNGKTIVHRTMLGAGDTLAVGREAKSLSKLPLTVALD